MQKLRLDVESTFLFWFRVSPIEKWIENSYAHVYVSFQRSIMESKQKCYHCRPWSTCTLCENLKLFVARVLSVVVGANFGCPQLSNVWKTHTPQLLPVQVYRFIVESRVPS